MKQGRPATNSRLLAIGQARPRREEPKGNIRSCCGREGGKRRRGAVSQGGARDLAYWPRELVRGFEMVGHGRVADLGLLAGATMMDPRWAFAESGVAS